MNIQIEESVKSLNPPELAKDKSVLFFFSSLIFKPGKMEPQHQLWHLVARKLSCEATDQELAELELLRRHDQELCCVLDMLASVWEQGPEANNTLTTKAISEQFSKLTQKLKVEGTHFGAK